jgi:hypothetical protein
MAARRSPKNSSQGGLRVDGLYERDGETFFQATLSRKLS